MNKFSASFAFTPSGTHDYLYLTIVVHERNDKGEIVRTEQVRSINIGAPRDPHGWDNLWPWLMELADISYIESSAAFARAEKPSISETNARPSDTTVPSSV